VGETDLPADAKLSRLIEEHGVTPLTPGFRGETI
jgi:hypothetical protein